MVFQWLTEHKAQPAKEMTYPMSTTVTLRPSNKAFSHLFPTSIMFNDHIFLKEFTDLSADVRIGLNEDKEEKAAYYFDVQCSSVVSK
jgi:hypothetical protein